MNPSGDGSSLGPEGRDAIAVELAAIVAAQSVLLEELVSATQDQIRTLIELRVHRDRGDALVASQVHVQQLTRRLEVATNALAPRLTVMAQALGVKEPSLRRLVSALPDAVRGDLGDGVSALRSLAQALAELQVIAQAHAQRGLHAVVAWRTVLGVPDHDAGVLYTRRGRARSRQRSAMPALSLDMDL